MKRTKEVRENDINEEEEQRWGKGEHSEEIKTDTELPEEFHHGLEDLPWNLNSLEQLLYISLPAWIQRALLCNLAEQFGIWTFHNNILPCRLISYALLPYTLPTTAVISFFYRFLRRARKLPHQALNAVREVIEHLRFALTHLRRLLPNRFLLLQIPPLVPTPALFLAPWSCLPPLSLTFLPCSSFPLLSVALRFLSCRLPTSTWKKHPERRSQSQSQTQPLLFRQRSFLCFQLTGSGDFCRKTDNIITDAKPLSSTFLLQLNLELEMDSHSETPQLQKDTLDYDRSLLLDLDKHRNAEVNLSSPCISFMDVQEED